MAAILVGTQSCSSSIPPRAQLVVFVDTDLATRSQAADDLAFSRDVSVDSVRVEVMDEAGDVSDSRDFVAPDPLAWPISFGIAPNTDSSPQLLRLRVFSAATATPSLIDGQSTVEPLAVTTIDRVVRLPLATSGVSAVHVLLAGDCIGRPASFANGISSCVDADHLSAPPSMDLGATSDLTPPASVVGTWPLAREVPCSGTPNVTNAVCVPGGVSLLGDPVLDHLIGYDTSPRRLVQVSPFFMDRTEMTVEVYRSLLSTGKVTEIPAPDPYDPDSDACDFSGKGNLPINCLSHDGFSAACTARGGSLPTEAQWEHAARGRGQSRRFPWGDQDPSCCVACTAKEQGCNGSLDPAGSSPARPAVCDGIGDQSRDGILDLGGSLIEFTRDTYAPYDSSCWAWNGLRKDPLCTVSGLPAVRGGSWSGGFNTMASVLRKPEPAGGSAVGARCVYPGSP